MSGHRRGALALAVRGLLALVALAYALALAARRALYALGIARRTRAPCPVLSVGNIVAGGTGKTPVVEHLARRLAARGLRPAIVSRGYGAPRPGAPNDEALVLERNLPGVPNLIDPDRVRGAVAAVERHGADCVILDDGFQHWRIERDLDLVLIDALEPFGHGRLLPRGLLREPLRSLERAHAIAVTRADLCPPERLAEIRAALGRLAPDRPILEVVEEPLEDAGWLRGKRVVAFCGIGNPQAFFARLERLGATLVARHAFPDHHLYAPGDLDAILATPADAIVTTEKDLVKLPGIAGADRVRVLRIRAAIRRGEEDLERLIDRALAPLARPEPVAPKGEGAMLEAVA